MTACKKLLFVFSLTALLLYLPACAASAPGNPPGEASIPSGITDMPSDEAPANSSGLDEPSAASAVLTARVVSADESGSLLLAGTGEQAGVYRSTVPDGESLRPGMLLDITYDGSVLETYPAQLCGITEVRILEDGFDDRCALYMDVFTELWETDEALQADTQYIGIDLSQTSLTKSEQTALAWRFGELHQKEPLAATYASLCEEGFIDGDALYWEDGCLLTVEETEADENHVVFNATKWRGGDGAYFLLDCAASRNESGVWGGYTVSEYAVS